MRMRWVTIAVTLVCFVAALLALPYVPRQFFPASDRPELLVDIGLPQNASIFASQAASTSLDGMLKDDPDVASWSSYVGRGAIRFYLPLDVKLANDFFSQAVVIAKDVPARERLHAKLEKALAEQLPNAVTRVSPLELGPPVGWPVQYRVSGPDTAEVRAIALKLGQAMGGDANVRLVNFDWMEPAREVRVKIDQDQARLLGLSSQTLSSVLNAVMSGTPITQIRDDIYLINVVARGERRAARLAVDAALAAAAAAQWPHGAAQPDGHLRFRAGISGHLAARSRSDADGAGGCQRRRDAGRRGRVADAGDRQIARESAGRLPHRCRRHGRGRARNRRPRCSPSCRSRCS